MGTKTHLAGAYRRAQLHATTATADEQPAAGSTVSGDVETYTFAAGDVLLGQEGWTLSSMHESAAGATALRASGRWDHPLHRGSWHRIVTERCEISCTARGDTLRAEFTLHDPHADPTLAVMSEARTTRHSVPCGTLLLPQLHACFGPMIETVARTTKDTGEPTPVALLGCSDSVHAVASFELVWLSAERSGLAILETPDGHIRADEYSIRAETGVQLGDWNPTTNWFVGGDGLLAGYTAGEAIVWRAASAPSRA